MTNEWDAIANEWNQKRPLPSATLSFFKPYATGTVLDAGCGNARNSNELAKTAEQVIALDASPAMLKTAEKNVTGLTNVTLTKGKIEKIPLNDSTVDAAFCLASLHHLKPSQQSRAFSELNRVLKKGGRLCLTVWNRQQKRFKNKPKELNVPWNGKPRYYYFFDESELIGTLESAGFTIEKIIYEKNGKEVHPDIAQNVCMTAIKK